jgi:hypothetical protein
LVVKIESSAGRKPRTPRVKSETEFEHLEPPLFILAFLNRLFREGRKLEEEKEKQVELEKPAHPFKIVGMRAVTTLF